MLPHSSESSLTFEELLGLKYIELKKLARARSVDIPRFATKTQMVRLILSQKNPNFENTLEGRHLSTCEIEEENIPEIVLREKAASIYYPLGSQWQGPQHSSYESKLPEIDAKIRQNPELDNIVPNYSPPNSSVFEPDLPSPKIPESKPPKFSIFEPDSILPKGPLYRPLLTSVFNAEPAHPIVPDNEPPTISIFEKNMGMRGSKMLIKPVLCTNACSLPPPPPKITPMYNPPNMTVFEPDPPAPSIDLGYKPPHSSVFEYEPDVPDVPGIRPPVLSVFDQAEPPVPDIPTDYPGRVSIFDSEIVEQKYSDIPYSEPTIPDSLGSPPNNSPLMISGLPTLLDMVKLRRNTSEDNCNELKFSDTLPSPPATMTGPSPDFLGIRNDTMTRQKIQSIPRNTGS